jgi:hypothetical protein
MTHVGSIRQLKNKLFSYKKIIPAFTRVALRLGIFSGQPALSIAWMFLFNLVGGIYE